MLVTKALALTCLKVMMDDELFEKASLSIATAWNRSDPFVCRLRRLSMNAQETCLVHDEYR